MHDEKNIKFYPLLLMLQYFTNISSNMLYIRLVYLYSLNDYLSSLSAGQTLNVLVF
jgi:hypothetical protein